MGIDLSKEIIFFPLKLLRRCVAKGNKALVEPFNQARSRKEHFAFFSLMLSRGHKVPNRNALYLQ